MTKSSVQMEHTRASSACTAGAVVAPSTPDAAAPIPDRADAVDDRGSASPCTFKLCSFWLDDSTVSAISTSVDFGSSGLFSPNLTMGIVSSMARANPLALLCRGLPMIFLGPYRSGWRCARTAPVMIMTRKSAVMIPVTLYRIIIATAVVGEDVYDWLLEE